MENYKELLSELYKEHAPEKLDQIDFYLDRYKGKEKQFYITQKAKYANKKSVKDSKKILEEAMARINKRKEEAKAVLHEEREKKEAYEAKEEKVVSQPILEKPVVPKSKVKENFNHEKPVPKPMEEKPIIPVRKPEVKAVIKEDRKEIKPVEIKPKVIVNEKIEDKEINPPIIKKVEEKPSVKNPKTEEPPKKDPPMVFNSAEQQRILDLKTKRSSFEEIRKSIQEEEAKEEESRKKRSPVFWYFGIAAIVLIALAIFIYFSYFYKSAPQKEPINVQKVLVDSKPVNTKDSKPTTVSKEETAKKSEESKTQKEIVKTKEELNKPNTKKQEPKVEPKKKAKPVQKKAQIKPTADRLYASDINRPAVFVGCYAVKQEALAQKKVANLKAQNLDAHYYWIPDMNANGNSFFKVVIGPFNSAQEAYPTLTKVQERINFDAYIIVVN